MQRASLYMVAGLLAWCPFFFGSNRVLPWLVNLAVAIAALALYLVPVVRGAAVLPVSFWRYRWLLLPVLGVLGWALVQLAPTGIDAISNPVWAHAAELTGVRRAGRITANPMLTEYALLRLVTCIVCGWLVLQLASESANAELLYRVLLWSGAAYGAYGLFQWIFLRDWVLWLSLPYHPTYLSATFVNRNSAATYFGMLSQIALAQLMRTYIRAQGGRDWVTAEKLRRLLGDKLDDLVRGALLFVFFAAIMVLTESRAGLAFAVAGWLLVAALTLFRRRKVGIGGLAFAALLVMLLVAVVDLAGAGLAVRLFQQGIGDVSRLDLYRISLMMIADYIWLGSGYGTWSTMFAMYRDGTIPPGPIYDKAHNTYLEIVLGLGLPAAVMLLSAYAMAFGRVLKGYFERERNRIYTCVAAAVTLQVGLHSLTDFSMQIQAVALVHTALIAIGVAQSWSSRPHRPQGG